MEKLKKIWKKLKEKLGIVKKNPALNNGVNEEKQSNKSTEEKTGETLKSKKRNKFLAALGLSFTLGLGAGGQLAKCARDVDEKEMVQIVMDKEAERAVKELGLKEEPGKYENYDIEKGDEYKKHLLSIYYKSLTGKEIDPNRILCTCDYINVKNSNAMNQDPIYRETTGQGYDELLGIKVAILGDDDANKGVTNIEDVNKNEALLYETLVNDNAGWSNVYEEFENVEEDRKSGLIDCQLTEIISSLYKFEQNKEVEQKDEVEQNKMLYTMNYGSDLFALKGALGVFYGEMSKSEYTDFTDYNFGVEKEGEEIGD